MSAPATNGQRLPWTGIVTLEQRIRLKAEFSNNIICPGYTGRFGKSDEAGMLNIVGASGGYADAKRTLRRWQGKQRDSTFQWWFAFIEKQSIEPIMTHDILDGISYSRWAAYAAAYKQASALERMRRYTARRRAQAIQEKEHDHGVARELLGLAGGGGSGGGASSSSE